MPPKTAKSSKSKSQFGQAKESGLSRSASSTSTKRASATTSKSRRSKASTKKK